MRFTDNLLTGTLIKRYKRFFVDVKVNNKIITAHCPNSGSMLGLLDKNNKIWISESNNPKRKLKFTLELIKVKDSLVGVNTIFANKIVLEALNNKTIKEFSKFKKVLYCNDIKEACKNVDLVIIHTEWEEFKALDFNILN